MTFFQKLILQENSVGLIVYVPVNNTQCWVTFKWMNRMLLHVLTYLYSMHISKNWH